MLEMNLKEDKKMELLIDNKYEIDMTKHLVAHGRTKHIEIRFHFLRDQVNNGKLSILEEQVKYG